MPPLRLPIIAPKDGDNDDAVLLVLFAADVARDTPCVCAKRENTLKTPLIMFN